MRAKPIYLALIAIVLLLAPHHADARAGGGGSVGSMGSHTYSGGSSGAAPITRSVTPQASPSYGASQPYTNSYNNGGGFMRGIAGGFLGAGLASLLFGHGGGYGGGGGIFPLLLIGLVIYWFVKRRGGFGNMMGGGMSAANYTMVDNPPQVATTNIAITPADQDAFEQLLVNIQTSWGAGDMAALRRYVTPEMLQYFSEELSANSSRGQANKVEQVKLVDANVTQAWHEYDLDYATAHLKWSALDYMAQLDKNPGEAGYVASGDAQTPQMAEEFWTFVRASGGHWLLSAIQQVA